MHVLLVPVWIFFVCCVFSPEWKDVHDGLKGFTAIQSTGNPAPTWRRQIDVRAHLFLHRRNIATLKVMLTSASLLLLAALLGKKHVYKSQKRALNTILYVTESKNRLYIFCTCVLLLYCATLFSWSTRKGWKMSRWKSEGRAVNTSRSSPTSRTRERDDRCAGDINIYHRVQEQSCRSLLLRWFWARITKKATF